MQLWSGRNCQRSSREFFVEIQHSSVIWAVFPGIKITGPCAFYELRQRRTADIDFVQIFRTTFHFTMARNEKWKAESLFFPPSLALVFCLLNICAALFCWHFFFWRFPPDSVVAAKIKAEHCKQCSRVIAVKHAAIFADRHAHQLATRPSIRPSNHPSVCSCSHFQHFCLHA